MKISVFMPLALCLTGCSLISPLILIPAPSSFQTRIGSNIPTSNQPCVKIQSYNQSELSLRKNILSEAAATFSLGNFEKLENYYSLYKQRNSRTPSGLWKLRFFYDGLFDTDLTNYDNENSWIKVETKIREWIKTYPQSPAPYIVYSNFLLRRGWHFRGGGFAHEIRPEAWEKFNTNIQLAKNVLEKNKELASVDPQWYANMLHIARLQSWHKREVKKLLREALSKEAYYHETYYEVFEYLLPKWGGSFEEAEQFADDAVVITSKCEGKGFYTRIYWRAFNEIREFHSNAFHSTPANWQKMSQSFEDIVKYYPVSWNVNSYGKFACFAGDKAKTKELLTKIGSNPIPEAWKQSGLDFSSCQKLAFES
ncbi:hypothetical protein A0J48_023290 [Sphaerospermopsis aphanizomenoides BCCUSP55]|uniref:hypothetical protein n=1 Tax=Sphaerospermopsis aphanizomenoides TaxID=459663 RepID=UPI00190606AE|nr:hypothetical protein [Sphaerospermopsis aphanizomenoides]MBK1990412.1 hypothetical protein [Sphaerospermopsis aphanizomenoides BCCUSP55]